MFVPESPVWLEAQGRKEEARVARVKMGLPLNEERSERNTAVSASRGHVSDIEVQHTSASISMSWLNKQIAYWHDMKCHYRQTIIVLFLSVAQQFCGHPNVLNYAPEIFEQAGVADAMASTVLLGVVKFLVTLLVICKIEAVGRRFLLLGGMAMIAVSLLVMALAFQGTKINAGWALAGAVGVVMGYAGSFGPLTWLLTSEMFPAEIRGRALGLSTVITYICASIVSYTFLSGQNAFGDAVPFAIYSLISIMSLAFAYYSIPDTRGKSPLQIEGDMRAMWMWRDRNALALEVIS